jgi:hypothetical protein
MFLVRTRDWSPLQSVETDSGVHQAFCSVVIGVPSPGANRPWTKGDQTFLFIAEVNNEWRSTSIPTRLLRFILN